MKNVLQLELKLVQPKPQSQLLVILVTLLLHQIVLNVQPMLKFVLPQLLQLNVMRVSYSPMGLVLTVYLELKNVLAHKQPAVQLVTLLFLEYVLNVLVQQKFVLLVVLPSVSQLKILPVLPVLQELLNVHPLLLPNV